MLVCLAHSPESSIFLIELSIAALVERRLIPAGPAYLAHVKRAVHKLTFEEHDKHLEEEQKRLQAHSGNGVNGEDDLGVGDEEEDEDLLSLDPKEWKVCRVIERRCASTLSIRCLETRPLCCPRSVSPKIQSQR